MYGRLSMFANGSGRHLTHERRYLIVLERTRAVQLPQKEKAIDGRQESGRANHKVYEKGRNKGLKMKPKLICVSDSLLFLNA